MALNITTHYKQPLTSKMLNNKVDTLIGGNIILEGFEVNKNNSIIIIAPGKCIIEGAIIESDEITTIQSSVNGDLFVGIEYIHEQKKVNFFAVSAGEEITKNKLLLAKISDVVACEEKMKSLMDLSLSLKSIKENILNEQELEYEGEHITNNNSVANITSELKVKGQTIVNAASIKEETEIYADLQSVESGEIEFLNTADGIIDGINIKGKTYQNVLQKDAFKNKDNFTESKVDLADGYISLAASGNYRNAYLKLDKAKLKPSTEYTIIFEILKTTLNGSFIIHSDETNYTPSAFTGTQIGYTPENNKLKAGVSKLLLRTKSDFSGAETALRIFVDKNVTEGSITFRYAIVEGDHVSNPDLNNYFEGIIGVGDNSESGYKIDILSCGQNLADISTSGNTNFEIGHIKKGQSYSLKFVKDRKDIKYNLQYKENNTFYSIDGCRGKSAEFITFTSDRDAILHYNAYDTDNISEIMLVEGICTSDNMPPFKPYECDDEQILLQEPLHSLSNNVYDEIVGDKIIRRVGKIVLNGNEDWVDYADQATEDTLLFQTYSILSATGVPGHGLCDEFILPQYNKSLWGTDINYEGIRVGRANNLGVDIRINKSRLATEDVDGLKQWLKINPLTFYYQLEAPIITPVHGNCILPNGVHDRVVDNEIERNVGKVSLGPDDQWTFHKEENSTVIFLRDLPGVKHNSSALSNTLPHSSVTDSGSCFNITTKLYVKLAKSQLTSNTIEGLKEWLLRNPTTVWYELEKPYYETSNKPKLKCFTPETNITGSTFIPTPFNIQSYGYRKEALIKPNTQYTICFNNEYINANFKNIKVDLGGTIQNVTANNSTLTLTLTTPTTLTHNELRIAGFGIKVSSVMCSEGSNYRAFVDGLASVGNKSKNLFNKDKVAVGHLLAGSTLEELNQSGEITNTRTTHWIKVKPNTVYRIEGYNRTICQFKSKSGVITQPYNNAIITTDSDTEYIRWYFCRDINTFDINNTVVKEGLEIPVYEPYYDGHKIEILSSGKNIFDKSTITDNSYIDANGDVISYNGWFSSDFIRVHKGEKYYIYNEKHREPFAGLYSYYYNVNKNKIERLNLGDVELVGIKEFVSKYDGYIRISGITRHIEKGKFYANSDKTQILLQEPLRSLPNGVCDTIEQVDGNYVVVRRCGEVLLDGSESWSKNETLNGTDTFFCYTKKIDMTIMRREPYCDRFITLENRKHADPNQEMCSCGDTTNPLIQFRIKKDKLTILDTNGVKRWFKDNPTKVVYELAQRLITPLDAIKLPKGTCDEVQDGKRMRKVGKIIYDGSEAWESYGRMSDNVYEDTIAFKLPFLLNNTNDNVNLLSNNFKATNLAFANDIEGFWDRDSTIRISIKKSKLETPDVAGFKKWLSENPTTVWYELATPAEEDYISTNLNLDTYEETTHITSNTSVPAIINAKMSSTIGSVIKNDIKRLEVIEDWIDKVILPSLVESHYQKTLLEFDYQLCKMLQ